MKKILLIGELNQAVSNLNSYLTDYYTTQLCADNPELVKGMVKVFKPDMALICLMGIGEMDKRIIDFLQDESSISILFVGTADECRGYTDYFEEGKFEFILRPTTQTELIKKCNQILKTDEAKPFEAFVSAEVRRKHILIVDDSAMSLRSLKSILDSQYDVSVALDGEKGFAIAEREHPDLILLDYEMPGWNGRKTLEEIRNHEETMDIPVMFLTGVADKEHIAAVLGMKPAGYLLKPVEQQKLLSMIEDILYLHPAGR